MSDTWTFPDPENLTVVTVDDVLSGRRPVVFVSHEVFDGSWQFLTGEEVGVDRLKLACLGEIVKLDASLTELSDLPLGWYAERPKRGAPWTRHPSFPTDWNELLVNAVSYTNACQERLKAEFSIQKWERYNYNQESATLLFSSEAVPRVTARIQIVGSWSPRSDTWLWSWDNESILPSATEYVHHLKTFGKQHDFERLVNPYWSAREVDGWEMASVACLLLEGEGVYRAPGESSYLFMVLREPQFVAS